MSETIYQINMLKPASDEWEAVIFGDITFTPIKGGEPNWFHRYMQQLAFGIVWRRKL